MKNLTTHLAPLSTALLLALIAALPAGPARALGAPEATTLAAMAEEEKMARDVYTALLEKWDLRVFARIVDAEQTHLDLLRAELAEAGLDDPTEGLDPGEFRTPEVASQYLDLVEQGQASREGALRVGAAVEEIDLMDLRDAVEQSSDAGIIATYELLMAGTRNHLRAFARNLDREGVDYAPQYLEVADYEEIIASAHERAGDRRRGAGEGRGGNGRGHRGGHGQGRGR